MWTSTANEIKVSIPSGAATGTTYTLQLYTCSLKMNRCSGSAATACTGCGQISLVIGQAARLFVAPWVTVLPGTSVGLHWAVAQPDEFFRLGSTAPDALPDFSSAISWPSQSDATYSSTDRLWSTTSNAAQISLPANAAGTYALQLYTCSRKTTLCSNSKGAASGPTHSEVTLSVPKNWRGTNLSKTTLSDLSLQQYAVTVPGSGSNPGDSTDPLDVTFDSAGNIWSVGEFSNELVEAASGSDIVTKFSLTQTSHGPFTHCLYYFTSGCGSTGISALVERIILANGMIWFTEGGWGFPSVVPNGVTNLSQVVAFNPSSNALCTYQVPGNDNEIVGITSTGAGSRTTIWFTETGGDGGPLNSQQAPAYLGYFEPARLGSCTRSRSYSQSTMASVLKRIPLMTAAWQISADSAANALWVTDFLNGQIQKISQGRPGSAPSTYALRPNPAPQSPPAVNPPASSRPWQIVADAGYVYATDYGDNNLIRINKSTGAIDYVPVPATSDTEKVYGLAICDGVLYFTLSDDSVLADSTQPFVASAIGAIDIADWEAASANCSNRSDCTSAPAPGRATIYYGLDTSADPSPSSKADFRGIALDRTCRHIAIADHGQILRLGVPAG
jgi:hypothetical protein